MFSRPRLILSILTATLLFSILSPRVFASDDSNPSGLTPTVNTTSSNLTTNQTIDAVNQLLQENNASQANNNASQDPRYQQFLQLWNQFQSEAHAGNNIAADQTRAQLDQYLKSPAMQQYVSASQGKQMISPALQSLLFGMIDKPDGFSVDPAAFQSIIQGFDSQGLVNGWSGESPFRTANDLGTLGKLMNGIDPTTGAKLLRDQNLLNSNIASGLFGKAPPGFGGGLGGLGGLGGQNSGIPGIPKLPSLNLPGGSLGNPSLPGVPSIPNVASSVPGLTGVSSIPSTLGQPTLPIILGAIAGVAAVLFIFRKRFGGLGRRITPTTLKTKPVKPETGLNLQSPRDLIIYYFRKVVTAMSKRGYPRLDPETHREFSGKCTPRPEAPPVKNISVLYEKAVFSGRDVTVPEADDAKGYSLQVEKTAPAEEKRRFGLRSLRSQTPKVS